MFRVAPPPTKRRIDNFSPQVPFRVVPPPTKRRIDHRPSDCVRSRLLFFTKRTRFRRKFRFRLCRPRRHDSATMGPTVAPDQAYILLLKIGGIHGLASNSGSCYAAPCHTDPAVRPGRAYFLFGEKLGVTFTAYSPPIPCSNRIRFRRLVSCSKRTLRTVYEFRI